MDGGLQENGDAGESDNTDREEEVSEEVVIPTKAQLLNPPTGIVPPSASVPTRIQNGRQICNLPDHPVHAGCTSVVAVIVGRMLVVANAGDSRAVLCRAGGLTEPLSFDHKPLQSSEVAASRQHALRPTRTSNNTDSSSIGGGVVKLENIFGEVDGGLAVLGAWETAGTILYLRLHNTGEISSATLESPEVLEMLENDQPEYYNSNNNSNSDNGISPGPYEHSYWNLLLRFVLSGQLSDAWTLLSQHSACRRAQEEAEARAHNNGGGG